MGAGVEVKVESGDEVEDYDGSYACLICTESVRGTAALVCWEKRHLPAQSAKEHVQGVRRGEHLPAKRSRCKSCKADKDDSMPPDLEKLSD